LRGLNRFKLCPNILMNMVTKKGDKWEAECSQCGWTGQADTKKEARELLRKHLDIHRTPKPVEEAGESEDISSPPGSWPDLDRPGKDPQQ